MSGTTQNIESVLASLMSLSEEKAAETDEAVAAAIGDGSIDASLVASILADMSEQPETNPGVPYFIRAGKTMHILKQIQPETSARREWMSQITRILINARRNFPDFAW